MSVSEKGLIKLARWPNGINNMAEEIAFNRDQFGRVLELAEAENVDLTAEGIAKRRKGQILVDSHPHHSLYCHEFPFGLCVTQGALKRLEENGEVSTLATGFNDYNELTYAELSDRIFYSDGARQGVVMRAGTVREMGVEVPPPPIVSPAITGGMGAGTYQVVLANRNKYGERSGTEEPITVEVPQGGGIRVQGIATPSSNEVAVTEVYISAVGGGETHYRASEVIPGVDDINIGGVPQGFQLDTLMLEAVPPASIYRIHNGRLLYVIGKQLGWSKAMRPTLCDFANDQIRFASQPTMVESLSQSDSSGFYVAAGGRTFWMAGADPNADGGWKPREVHPYGAVKGSSLLVPAKAFDQDASPVGRYAYWLDTGGHFCIGKPGGIVERIGARRLNVGVPDRAASGYREVDGMRHVITSMRGTAVKDGFKMSDSLGVTLVRRAGQ